MNVNDKDLQDALRLNGNLDTEEADTLKANVLTNFKNTLRKVTRLRLLGNGLIFVLGLVFFCLFKASESTKDQILYAALIVLMAGGMIWGKAYFWMTRTKMLLLREIWLLRLGISQEYEETESSDIYTYVSKREKGLWEAATLSAVAAVLVCAHLGLFGAGEEYYRTEIVDLSRDGSGLQTTHNLGPVHRGEPQTTFDFNVGGKVKDPENYAWFDDQGRRLIHYLSYNGGESRFSVQLLYPFMPDKRSYVRVEYQSQSMAEQDGQSWVFRRNYTHGHEANHYCETVVLPPGAVIESTIPESEQNLEINGRPAVVLKATRRSARPFECEVRYSLP